jgi:hypothetical protein
MNAIRKKCIMVHPGNADWTDKQTDIRRIQTSIMILRQDISEKEVAMTL